MREKGRRKLDDARKGGKLKNSWHPLPWPLSTRSRDDDVPTDTPSRFLFRISFPYGSNGWIFFFSSYYFFRTIVLLARQRVKGRRLCLRANISIMEWNKYGNNNNNDKKKMIKRKRNKYWGKERRNVKIKYSI